VVPRYQPARPITLTKPDQINQASDVNDQDIEIGETLVNSKTPVVGAGQSPIGQKQASAMSKPAWLSVFDRDQCFFGRD
jgi:hypothetical protein